MGDLRRTGLMNLKREPSVGVFSLVEADIITPAVAANPSTGQIAVPANTALVAQLPERCLITGVSANVTTASATVGAVLDVSVNGVAVATGLAADAVGVVDALLTSTARYFATGGQVTVTPGLTAPATGSLVVEIILEYIELDKTEDYVGLMA